MRLKPGVRLLGLRPEMWAVVLAARELWHPVTLTSAVEGTHSPGSHHYKGYALDLRTHGLSVEPQDARQMLQEALGGDFQVILEEDHLHVEFDPQEPL